MQWHHSQLCLLTHLQNFSCDLGSARLEVLLPKENNASTRGAQAMSPGLEADIAICPFQAV